MQIGAQLYTVREFMKTEEGVVDTFRKIREIGFSVVQVSGMSAPISPQRLRQIADDNRLRIVLTHTDQNRIKNDTLAVIREHEAMGCTHIGIGCRDGGQYKETAADYRRMIADFTPAARLMKEHGMALHYHNHNFEFERMDGAKTGFDILTGESDPALWQFTVDTYWVQAGGRDPAATIAALPGRVSAVHIKDMAIVGGGQRFAAVGEGNLDFAAIMDACKRAGVEWALIEQDDCYGEDPFAKLAISLENASRYL
ncbi:MAG: sugar phosphate isomerase/epimerase family protein [Acutalibacteraceae bacterium]|jgi:sugar phosphate isomerase/epimerase